MNGPAVALRKRRLPAGVLGQDATAALPQWPGNVRELENVIRFALAMEHASIGMALVAPDGRWIKVNAALCELMGYDEAELTRTDFQTITHWL